MDVDVSPAAEQTSAPAALPGYNLGATLSAPSPRLQSVPAAASASPSAEASAAILTAAPGAVLVSASAIDRPQLQQPADEQNMSASEGAANAHKPLSFLYDSTELPSLGLDGKVWDHLANPAPVAAPGVCLIMVPGLIPLGHVVDGAHSYLRNTMLTHRHAWRAMGPPDVLVHMPVPAGSSVCAEVLLELLPSATDTQRAGLEVLFVYAACNNNKPKWESRLSSTTSADHMQALEAVSRLLHVSTVVVDLRRWAGDRTSKLGYCDVVHHVVFDALPDRIDYITLHEMLRSAFELSRSSVSKKGSRKGKATPYGNGPRVIRLADVAASNLSRVVVAHLPDACDELRGQTSTSVTRMGIFNEAITPAMHVTHNVHVKHHLDRKNGSAGEHGVGNSGVIAWVGDDEPAMGGVFHNYSALCSIPSRSGVTVTYLRSWEQWHGTAAFAEDSKGSRYGVALVNNGHTQTVTFRDAASEAI